MSDQRKPSSNAKDQPATTDTGVTEDDFPDIFPPGRKNGTSKELRDAASHRTFKPRAFA